MSGADKIVCKENETFRICDCVIKMDTKLVVSNPDYDKVNSVYEFTARSIKGEVIKLQNYNGYVCIFVNMATKSPFSDPNIKILNDLYQIYCPFGLRVLGFPCNQFNNAEPNDAFEIMRYAAKHKIKWDIFEKTDVNGPTACELFKYIKQKAPGPRVLGESCTLLIKSNYTKFIVNRSGIPEQRFPPTTEFKVLEKALLFFLNLDEPIEPIIVEKPRIHNRDNLITPEDVASTKATEDS